MWVQEFDDKITVTCKDPLGRESYTTVKTAPKGFFDSALSLTIVDAMIGTAGYIAATLIGD